LGVDLDAFVDPPSANPRETLGILLERAAKNGVEIRVILPDQPQEGQAVALARVAQLGGGGILDPFHKIVGTHHQKFVVIRNAGGVVAFCGCNDIDNARLGPDGVPAGATPTNPQKPAPWHDPQVKIRGPAVADLWNSFVQRYNEVATTYMAGFPVTKNPATGMTAYPKFNLREVDPVTPNPKTDGLEIQVVRTYPNKSKKHVGDELIVYPRQSGYDFALNGEMGIYRLLVRALQLTKYTIYLEDQYLVNTVAMASNPPITEAIKQALDKTSFQKMIIAVAGKGTVRDELYQDGSRRADFIRQLGAAAGSKVETFVYLPDNNSPYWLHSKLWIFDDEFAIIGSANCNRRGYSYDSELCVGIADPRRLTGGMYFAKRLRMNLWLKHLNGLPTSAGVGAKGKYTDADVQISLPPARSGRSEPQAAKALLQRRHCLTRWTSP
jgi:phosphatidylserine/phosphatidylglycerophosphate/cardiolipin synthase-like enzyme